MIQVKCCNNKTHVTRPTMYVFAGSMACNFYFSNLVSTYMCGKNTKIMNVKDQPRKNNNIM